MTEYPNEPLPSPAYPATQTSTLAIMSLVSGILGWIGLLGIGPIVAIITGHMAKSEIRRSGGTLGGDGLATAGLVLGYLNLALTILVICLIVLGGLAFFVPFASSFQ